MTKTAISPRPPTRSLCGRRRWIALVRSFPSISVSTHLRCEDTVGCSPQRPWSSWPRQFRSYFANRIAVSHDSTTVRTVPFAASDRCPIHLSGSTDSLSMLSCLVDRLTSSIISMISREPFVRSTRKYRRWTALNRSFPSIGDSTSPRRENAANSVAKALVPVYPSTIPP